VGGARSNDTGSSAATTDTSLPLHQGLQPCRIWSDSLQAVADSMYYPQDSIFRLYKDPVAWAAVIPGYRDTMFVYTKTKKPTASTSLKMHWHK